MRRNNTHPLRKFFYHPDHLDKGVIDAETGKVYPIKQGVSRAKALLRAKGRAEK